MSCIKNYLFDCIENLSKQTGYSFEFLMDVWIECMEDGADWDFFVAVTLERDW